MEDRNKEPKAQQANMTMQDALNEIVNETGSGQQDQVAMIANIAVQLVRSTVILGDNPQELAAPYARAAMGLLKACHVALVDEQNKAIVEIQGMVDKRNAQMKTQRDRAPQEAEAIQSPGAELADALMTAAAKAADDDSTEEDLRKQQPWYRNLPFLRD